MLRYKIQRATKPTIKTNSSRSEEKVASPCNFRPVRDFRRNGENWSVSKEIGHKNNNPHEGRNHAATHSQFGKISEQSLAIESRSEVTATSPALPFDQSSHQLSLTVSFTNKHKNRVKNRSAEQFRANLGAFDVADVQVQKVLGRGPHARLLLQRAQAEIVSAEFSGARNQYSCSGIYRRKSSN